MTHMRAFTAVFSLAATAVFALACGGPGRGFEIQGISEEFRMFVSADSLPPRAQDEVSWRLRVKDIKTGRPIEGGQANLWARNKDGHEVQVGFVPAQELGTYSSKLSLVTAGQWQMGVRFRRDSLSPFATMAWVQEVRSPRPMGG